MLTMTDLVDSPRLFPVELAVLPDSILLKEKSNFISRRQEILVSNVVIIPRGEFSLFARINGVYAL